MSTWFVNLEEIQSGNSAVLGGNYYVFYTLHCTALVLLITSLTSCYILIGYILIFTRKERWDFPDRFPLYQAVADVIWGMCNISEHIILITTQVYPEMSPLPWQNVSVWVFAGYVYQELMHAGLAIYAYYSIVKNHSLDLGKGDWKLHCCCIAGISLVIGVFWPLGAFGPSGYWLVTDVNSPIGFRFGLYICATTTTHALGSTWCYVSIHKVVEAQKKKMTKLRASSTVSYLRNPQQGPHKIASDCLNTFVCISLCLYCPLAFGSWAFLLETGFGFIEPLAPLFIIIVSNSIGWANAVAYMRNRRLKVKTKSRPETRSCMDESNSHKMEDLSGTTN